jgi:hypothetical protein
MDTKISEAEIAYFAGIIDGEGTITISRAARKDTKHKLPAYIPHMKVCNTDKALIDWIQKTFGGCLNNVRQSNDKWSTLYYLRWNCTKARTVLEMLLPYLRVKRLQALLVLEFVKRMNEDNYRGIILPPEEHQIRALLHSLVSRLNLRGPTKDAERLSEEATQTIELVRQSDPVGTKLREPGRNAQAA